MELVKVGSELSGVEGGHVALGVDIEGRVVAFDGEEGGYAGRGVQRVVVSKFGEWEEVGPIVLLVQTIMPEVLL